MKKIILLPVYIIFIVLFLVSLVVSVVQAQEGGIVLKSQEVLNQFPEGVLFQVRAETMAPAQIKEIRLEMSLKGSNRSSYAYLEFTPAIAVEGRYLLRTSGAQYKPPGTLVEYSFIISDSEQRILETPKETHLYLDNRFEWSRVAEGLVEVYYYGPLKTRAELILEAAAQAMNKIGNLLGIEQSEALRVIAYNNAYDLIAAQPFESKTSERELLLEGITFSEYGTFLMVSGVDRPDGVASHEMTHVLVGQLTKNAFVGIPAWLNEGLAEYGNINQDSTFGAMLSQAIAQKRLLPLRTMQTPPGISSDRLLMYGQGYAVVKYMIDTYGEDKFRGLFTAFNKGLRIDEALTSVYGFDQDGLDNAWRDSLGLPPLEKEEPAPTEPVPVVKGKGWEFSRSIIIGAIAAMVIVGLVLGVALKRRARSGSG